MKSISITSLLAEVAELDLYHRRKLPTTRFIAKYKSMISHPLIEALLHLGVYYSDQKTDYWKRREEPLLFWALKTFDSYNQHIGGGDLLPCYFFPFEHQVSPIPSSYLPGDKGAQNNDTFNTYVNQRYHNFVLTFTDCSVDEVSSRSGSSVYLPSSKHVIQKRLPDNTQIYRQAISNIIRHRVLF